METAIPIAYLITFTCHGTVLHTEHADERAMPPPLFFTHRTLRAKSGISEPAYFLDELRRIIVLRAIEEVCDFHAWALYAAHVRTQHVHCVVRAPEPPLKILNLIKTNASRRLHESKLERNRVNRWSQHAATQPLWQEASLLDAIRYVVEEQGIPMAVCEYIVPAFEKGAADAS